MACQNVEKIIVIFAFMLYNIIYNFKDTLNLAKLFYETEIGVH